MTDTTPDAARTAVAAAEAAFQHATTTCDSIQFGNLATWVIRNLIVHAVEPARSRIARLREQLNYAPAAEQAASMYAAMVDAANDMAEICRRISAPETMRSDLGRLYRELAPGSTMADPLRTTTAEEETVARMAADFRLQREAESRADRQTAFAGLAQMRQRGILVDVTPDGDLKVAGDASHDDLAFLRTHKATVTAVLATSVTL